jgi:hypothetical protein
MELAASPRPETHALLDRFIGALLLRPKTYDEIKRDPSAIKQGAAIVLVTAFFSAFWSMLEDPRWIVLILIEAFLWLVTASLLFLSAKFVVVSNVNWGMADGLLRASAFASAPTLSLAVIPDYWYPTYLGFIFTIWYFAGLVVAIRQSLEISITRAIVLIVVTGVLCGIAFFAGLVAFFAVVVEAAL